MTPSAAIITAPHLNQNIFLPVCQNMLGYSPARAADAANLTGVPHLMSILAAFKNKNTPATIKAARDIYDLIHFNCLIAADDYDMISILEVLSGMPFVATETLVRGVQAVVVGGTLHEWRDAIYRGCRLDQTTQVRACFDKLYLQFVQLGLTDIFGRTKHQAADQTFYLEENR